MASDTRLASPVHSAPPPVRRSRAGLVIVSVIAVAIALISLVTYASGSLAELAAEDPEVVGAYVGAPTAVRLAFYGHVVAGSLALVLGPVQFSRRIRTRAARLHRVVGRTYLAAVASAVAAATILLPFNSVGLVGVAGFGTLAALWATTGVRAYRAIRAGDVASHQAWMMRNYALTFAAPTLRIWVGFLIAVQVPFVTGEPDSSALFTNAYAVVPFLCWLPNLVVAEWLIRRRGLPSYRLPPPVSARR